MADRYMFLTDEQYVTILEKIKAVVFADGFKPSCYDCTDLGNKSTGSNCGFCNDGFTEEETALFPDDFPGRRTMKHRGHNHKCPFDMRSIPSLSDFGSGCFYDCYLFRNRKSDIDLMKEMVEDLITELDIVKFHRS